MIKKILGLGIALLMLFSLAACSIDFNFVSYKADAKVTIQTYADTKQRDFNPDNWLIVSNIVTEGKESVDTAESKTDVDIIVNDVKSTIDEVEMERSDGLNCEIRLEILNWSLLYLDLNQNSGVTREDMGSWWIDYYYGQYNGFHVFHFRVWGFGLEIETIIDNLSFQSRGTLEILAVKEDRGMSLKELYEDGYITRADLEKIYNIYINKKSD